MSLDLIPLRRLRVRKDGKTVFSFDDAIVHSDLAPCPFAADANPTAPLLTCCSFHAGLVVEGLEALGENDVVRLMHDDMTAEQAKAFSKVLQETADHWEKMQHKEWERWFGPSEEGQEKDREWIYLADACATLKDVLCVLRKAANWYEKASSFGCFVLASY